jgi:hypothetical protein
VHRPPFGCTRDEPHRASVNQIIVEERKDGCDMDGYLCRRSVGCCTGQTYDANSVCSTSSRNGRTKRTSKKHGR